MSGTDPGGEPAAAAGGAVDPVALLPPLREVVAAAGFRADKRLGQHFLFDLNLCRRIARAGGPLDLGTVIEIGPGPGGLTRALLLEGATRLVAIDRDPRTAAALAPVIAAAGGRLELRLADAVGLDLAALGPPPRRIVANLPYNVGTKLLVDWLTAIDPFASLTVMLQKEVVDRLAAAPGGKDYGRLSVLAQAVATVAPVLTAPPRAFTPPPRVDSALVRLDPRADRPSAAVIAALERITAAAFGQRRKMLRQSLRAAARDADMLIGACGLVPTARAEDLTVDQHLALARALAASETRERDDAP